MAKVTFACECPQSHVGVFIQRATQPAQIASLLFETTGKKSATLAAGAWDVAYRAQGTPRTTFSLKVAEGGTMSPVERTLSDQGQAAGTRTLTVS